MATDAQVRANQRNEQMSTGPKTEVGKYRINLTFAGPANNVSTATIEDVQLELLRIDHDEVDGSLSEDATDSSAHATFKAPVCPNT